MWIWSYLVRFGPNMWLGAHITTRTYLPVEVSSSPDTWYHIHITTRTYAPTKA
jgi:hypothetical protein